MPGRPPKKWMKHCIKGVEKTPEVKDSGAVCGDLWYNKMSESQRRSAIAKERRERKHRRK